MLEIKPDGRTFYLWPGGNREYFGTLEPVDDTGYRKLRNPTPAFWKLWKQHPWRMKNQLSFQVSKTTTGKWEVHMYCPNGLDSVAKSAKKSQQAANSFRERRNRCESRGAKFRLRYGFGWSVYIRGKCYQDRGTYADAVSMAEAVLDM